MRMPSDRAVNVELRYFAGCPNWETTCRLIESITGRPPVLRRVDTAAEAEAMGFSGSPTVIVEGVDPWADQTSAVGLACRIYRAPDGRMVGGPTEEMLTRALDDRL